MKAFYNFTEALRAELESNVLLNSTTFGDLAEVEIFKRELLPLAHVSINTGSIATSTTVLRVSVIFMDVVDINPRESSDRFLGNDNEHWVLNNMLTAATKTVQVLQRGDLYVQGFQVEEDAELEFFSERFDDKMAGVTVSFDVVINNNLTLC